MCRKRDVLHFLNSLHIYCRLRDIGISKNLSKKICRGYEKSVFRLIRIFLHSNGFIEVNNGKRKRGKVI